MTKHHRKNHSPILKYAVIAVLGAAAMVLGITELLRSDQQGPSAAGYWAWILLVVLAAGFLLYLGFLAIRRLMRRLPSRSHQASHFSLAFWAVMAAILYLAVSLCAMGHPFGFNREIFGMLLFFPPMARIAPMDVLFGVILLVVCFLLHAAFLLMAGKAGTYAIRRRTFWIALLALAALAAFLASVAADHRSSQGMGFGQFPLFGFESTWSSGPRETALGILATGLFFLFWFPGLIIYSIPSSRLALIPLALHYGIICFYLYNSRAGMVSISVWVFAYLPLAGYLFPFHRRLAEYWRPARLPRIAVPGNAARPIAPRRAAGYTLIELLIAIALIAILTAGLLTLSSTAMRMQQRQASWRSALQIAEDEVALLRAKPELPPLGIHPLDAELLAIHPLAAQGEIEVKPGNSDRLREVRITFRLRGDGLDKDIRLAAILPANPSPAAVPPERAAPTPRPGEANNSALPGASIAEANP